MMQQWMRFLLDSHHRNHLANLKLVILMAVAELILSGFPFKRKKRKFFSHR